jgi:5-methylcytosine-specific restriction enzyme A
VPTSRPQRPCTAPGCPQRTYGGKCSRHARLSGQQRTHWRELYGDAWPRIRLEYLARHPTCLLCGRMASVADHHPRGIRLLKKQGNPDPHADRHLRPLCASCHSRETGRLQPGGWNAR